MHTCNIREHDYEVIKLFPSTAIPEATVAKVEFSSFVTSDWSTVRKRHFDVPSHTLRRIMSSPLSKEPRQKYSVRSVPI